MWRRFTTNDAEIERQEREKETDSKQKMAFLSVVGPDYDIACQNLVKEFCIFSECTVSDVRGFYKKPKKEQPAESLFSRFVNFFFEDTNKTVFMVNMDGYVYICDVFMYTIPGNILKNREYHMKIPHASYLITQKQKQMKQMKI
jgi:hypothetical protein